MFLNKRISSRFYTEPQDGQNLVEPPRPEAGVRSSVRRHAHHRSDWTSELGRLGTGFSPGSMDSLPDILSLIRKLRLEKPMTICGLGNGHQSPLQIPYKTRFALQNGDFSRGYGLAADKAVCCCV